MRQKGLALVLATAVISGFSVFSNKLFVTGTEPMVFTTIRNALVLVFLAVILIRSGKLASVRTLTKKELAMLGVIGITGGGVAFALFFTGLSGIGAVQGTLIHKTLFLWVAMLAYPFLAEKPSRNMVAGYLLIIAGTFAAARPQGFAVTPYAFMTLAATIIWAFENILAKITLKSVPHEIVGFARILFGLPVLLAVTAFQGKAGLFVTPSSYNALPLAVSAVLLTGYIYTWYRGLKYVPVTVATAVLVIAPVITTLLTAGFIDGRFPTQSVVPSAVLVTGVILIALAKTGTARTPEVS
jgi:O-acetylserine/cysteine efflux transporter